MTRSPDVPPTADELRLAMNTLHRKAVQDFRMALEYEKRGDFVTAQAYEQRQHDLMSAVALIIACLEGELPGI